MWKCKLIVGPLEFESQDFSTAPQALEDAYYTAYNELSRRDLAIISSRARLCCGMTSRLARPPMAAMKAIAVLPTGPAPVDLDSAKGVL
jgi:hypothetical protein